jgi:hypothetical protein
MPGVIGLTGGKEFHADEMTDAQPDWQTQPRRSQNLPADRQQEQMNAGDRLTGGKEFPVMRMPRR